MSAVSSTRNRVPRGMMTVPYNQWYVAAGRAELSSQPLARRLLDKPVVLYRAADGRAVALLDRCPHRLAPLSKGKVIGDLVQCPYHGFEFGPDGKCLHIPTQDFVPAAMCVESYPVEERGFWIWIWMGDKEKADPTLIPTTDYIKPTHKTTFHLCYECNGNFLRLHENLLDTSHPTFLHEGFFDDGDLAGAPYEVESEGKVVRIVRRSGAPVMPGPGTRGLFHLAPGKPILRYLVSEARLPSLITIVNRFYYADDPELLVAEQIFEFPVTPRGPKSCYQFWASASSFPVDHSERLHGFFRAIMAGDDMALEYIEERLEEDPDAIEVSVKADEAAIRFRRMLMKMVEEERQTG